MMSPRIIDITKCLQRSPGSQREKGGGEVHWEVGILNNSLVIPAICPAPLPPLQSEPLTSALPVSIFPNWYSSSIVAPASSVFPQCRGLEQGNQTKTIHEIELNSSTSETLMTFSNLTVCHSPSVPATWLLLVLTPAKVFPTAASIFTYAGFYLHGKWSSFRSTHLMCQI